MGRKRKIRENLAGKRFERWLVLERIEKYNQKEKKSAIFYKCQCNCGSIKLLHELNLIHQATKSCGCLKIEKLVTRSTKYTPEIKYAAEIFKKYKDGNLTLEDFLKMSKLDCHYCGSKPERTYKNYTYNGLDRKDSNLPHSKDNCVPCCWKCNTAKLNYSIDEFKNWIVAAYNCFILEKNGQVK